MLELPTLILGVLTWVKPDFKIFMHAPVDDPEAKKGQQREVIEAALKKLGVDPKKAGFQVLGGKVGLRATSIYHAWLGHSPLGAAAMQTIRLIAEGELANPPTDLLRDRPLPVQYIPRISWAHAGELNSFEELPMDWQDTVANTSNDPKAFALSIKGDCMSPDFAREGDDVIVTPSAPIRDGCLVVARLHDGSVLFRRYNLIKPNGKAFRLSCSNKDYAEPLNLTWKDVVWVYRVPSAVRKFD